jgi:DNA-binding transcriptional MerR regulator
MLIGEFARRARLPVSTLRYYDRLGVLRPAAVDPVSGYRRYDAEQLALADRIARLRGLGLTPTDIAAALAGGPAAAAVLGRQRRRVVDRIGRDRRRLAELDELLAAGTPPRVEPVELAPREVVARPFLLPADDLVAGVARSIAALRSTLRRHGLRRTSPWGATFPAEQTGLVSGYAFTSVGRPGGDLDSAWLPAGRAARVEHRGTVHTLPAAHRAAFAAVHRFGGVPAGPVIEEYPALDGGSGTLVSVPYSC